MGADTPFPERESTEWTYQMTPDYVELVEDVLDYCCESVSVGSGLRQQQQRVRCWAALAILRCVLSSPAAASAVLENCARTREQGVAMSQSPERPGPVLLGGRTAAGLRPHRSSR